MQTIHRNPSLKPTRGGRRPWLAFVLVTLVILCLAVIVLAIFNKWAVLALTLVAAVAGLVIWTWQRGFRAIEIVAFLIHFDGLEFGLLSVGRAAAVVCTIIIVRKLVVERWRPPAIQFKNWLPVWLLFSWVTVTGIWAPHAGGWFKSFLMLYLAFMFFCLTSMLIESHKDIQRFLRAFWFGGLFGSGAGVLALFLGTRSVGFGGDPNYFGLLEASMIPLTVYYLRNATNPRERLFYMATLAGVLAGAGGAGSRSGLIGGALVIVATLVTKPGISTGRRIRAGAVAVVVAPLAFLIGFIVNPANVERGLADRGAGRIDFWTTTREMISERPILGRGLGQTQYEIPQRLLVTPGTNRINEKREAVSSHNVWLDVLSDTGVIGVSLFALCFVMAAWSLARPRWPYTSDLSTTILVMLIPVLSSSMFLPLLNNKLAWSIIGLGAALQVPSDSSRWGSRAPNASIPADVGSVVPLASTVRTALGSGGGPPGPSTPGTELVPYVPDGRQSSPVVREQAVLANPLRVDQMPDVILARWDLRLTRAMLGRIVALAVVAAVATFMVGSRMPASYVASAQFIAPKLDLSFARNKLSLPIEQGQQVLVLAKSELYAKNLIELSGIDRPVDEVLDGVNVKREKMGGLVSLSFTNRNRAVVEDAAPFLIPALSQIYESARDFGAAGVGDQVRPVNPGEQSYYDGPPIIAVFDDPTIGVKKPNTRWMGLMGGSAAAIFGLGLALSGCRRPRIAPNDDLEAHTGVPVWINVDLSRRQPVDRSVAQVRQLAVTMTDAWKGERPLRRILVSPVERRADVGDLTVDLCAALILQGDRVVVVDCDVEHMSLWNHLCGGGARPGPDEPLDLRTAGLDSLSRPAHVMASGLMGEFRVLSGAQLVTDGGATIGVERLAEIDDSVTIVVLAPPLDSEIGMGSLATWAQTTVVPMRTGRTTTADAMTATSRLSLLGHSNNGIVLING